MLIMLRRETAQVKVRRENERKDTIVTPIKIHVF